MNQPPAAAPTEPTGRKGPGVLRAIGFLGRHPIGALQAAFASLVAIVILQNLEATSIDVLFWSIHDVPKLVFALLSMLIGAAAWEILRRLLRRR